MTAPQGPSPQHRQGGGGEAQKAAHAAQRHRHPTTRSGAPLLARRAPLRGSFITGKCRSTGQDVGAGVTRRYREFLDGPAQFNFLASDIAQFDQGGCASMDMNPTPGEIDPELT